MIYYRKQHARTYAPGRHGLAVNGFPLRRRSASRFGPCPPSTTMTDPISRARVRARDRDQPRHRRSRARLRPHRQFDGAGRRRRAQSVRRARARRRLGRRGHGHSARRRGASLTGYKKASILAALISGLMLLVAVGAIAAEVRAPAVRSGAACGADDDLGRGGCDRRQPPHRNALFARGRARDLNARAAFQHMAADAAVSAAVVVAGLRHPVDRPGVGRSGDEPGGRAGDRLEQLSGCSRNRSG